jgi:hypothetical protein
MMSNLIKTNRGIFLKLHSGDEMTNKMATANSMRRAELMENWKILIDNYVLFEGSTHDLNVATADLTKKLQAHYASEANETMRAHAVGRPMGEKRQLSLGFEMLRLRSKMVASSLNR